MPRKTRQKELLLSEVEKLDVIFSADDLFKLAREKDTKIGIATVYRFLRNLMAKQQLHSYLCNRRMVYSKDMNSHCHFICQKCGKVAHFKVEDIGFIKEKIDGQLCHFQIDVHGLCRGCLKAE
ncbi:MAG: transcriptional repressor [archaeon]